MSLTLNNLANAFIKEVLLISYPRFFYFYSTCTDELHDGRYNTHQYLKNISSTCRQALSWKNTNHLAYLLLNCRCRHESIKTPCAFPLHNTSGGGGRIRDNVDCLEGFWELVWLLTIVKNVWGADQWLHCNITSIINVAYPGSVKQTGGLLLTINACHWFVVSALPQGFFIYIYISVLLYHTWKVEPFYGHYGNATRSSIAALVDYLSSESNLLSYIDPRINGKITQVIDFPYFIYFIINYRRNMTAIFLMFGNWKKSDGGCT